MKRIALATALAATSSMANATEVSITCQITNEQTFTTSSLGTFETHRNPLTIENFTITDAGIRGYPDGRANAEKAIGSDYRMGIHQSVEIDRKTGVLKEMAAGDPLNGITISIFKDGTCRKQDGF